MKKKTTFLALLTLATCSAQASESADHLQQLSATIQDSPFGAVTRMQSVLTSVCEKKGIADALRPARDRALLLMLRDGQVSEKTDDPALVFEVSAALATSYARGVSFAIGPDTTTKLAICHSLSKAASGLIGSHGGS